MKICKLVFILLLVSSSKAYAWGGCAGKVPPICMYPTVPVCVGAGVATQDYYICIEE